MVRASYGFQTLSSHSIALYASVCGGLSRRFCPLEWVVAAFRPLCLGGSVRSRCALWVRVRSCSFGVSAGMDGAGTGPSFGLRESGAVDGAACDPSILSGLSGKGGDPGSLRGGRRCSWIIPVVAVTPAVEILLSPCVSGCRSTRG